MPTFIRSYATSTDEQLYEVLEQTRQEHSNTSFPSIPEIFRSWSNNPGFPILNVRTFEQNKTAQVSQELFMPLINSTEPSEFYILFNYATSSSGASGFETTTPSNMIQATATEIEISDNDYEWVIFNVQQTGKCIR